jgi:hypothetical protein
VEKIHWCIVAVSQAFILLFNILGFLAHVPDLKIFRIKRGEDESAAAHKPDEAIISPSSGKKLLFSC